MAPAHISQEQADEFAIGALEPESERLISLHAAECPNCRDVVAEARRIASAFALAASPPRNAPRALRRRTLIEAGIASPSPLVLFTRWARAVAGVAAVLIAAASFTGMVLIRDQVDDLRHENSALVSQVAETLSQEVEIAILSRQVEDQEAAAQDLARDNQGNQDLLVALIAPGTRIADVFTVDAGEGERAIGRLVWDESQKRLWIVATELDPRPAGQTYQLWVNSEGNWVSLGTFNSDSSGFVRYDKWVPGGIQNYESALVTIERAGGATVRQGESVFQADLSDLRREPATRPRGP